MEKSQRVAAGRSVGCSLLQEAGDWIKGRQRPPCRKIIGSWPELLLPKCGKILEGPDHNQSHPAFRINCRTKTWGLLACTIVLVSTGPKPSSVISSPRSGRPGCSYESGLKVHRYSSEQQRHQTFTDCHSQELPSLSVFHAEATGSSRLNLGQAFCRHPSNLTGEWRMARCKTTILSASHGLVLSANHHVHIYTVYHVLERRNYAHQTRI